MLRIKPYFSSKAREDYLNKQSKKGYQLTSITPFDLFVPLRLDAYKFTKSETKNRVYRVDNRHIKKDDFQEYRQIFLDDGWQYFNDNYTNDEYNNDHIFFCDDPSKYEIFSDSASIKQRNRNNAASSLYKGIFLFLAFIVLSVTFPAPFTNNSNSIIGFLMHNVYIEVAIIIIIVSFYRYIKNK